MQHNLDTPGFLLGLCGSGFILPGRVGAVAVFVLGHIADLRGAQ